MKFQPGVLIRLRLHTTNVSPWGFILALSLTGIGFGDLPAAWKKLPLTLGDPEARRILALADSNATILIGTAHGLYRFSQKDETSRRVLSLPGSQSKVNFLYYIERGVFAAMDAGLFFSFDDGQTWKRIFYSADATIRQCLAVLVDGDTIYLGTTRGLFHKNFSDPSWQDSPWQKERKWLPEEIITSLASDDEYVYIGTDRKLYRIWKQRDEIQQVFSLLDKEGENEIPTAGESPDVLASSQIKQLQVAFRESPRLYLATTRGIFESVNQGRSWTRWNSDSLPFEALTSFLVVQDDAASAGVFVSTTQGVFQYDQDNQRWLPLYKGMETYKVNFLTQGPDQTIYVATDRGVFFMVRLASFAHHLGEANHPERVTSVARKESKGLLVSGTGTELNNSVPVPAPDYAVLEDHFHHEPSIHEVQEMAVHYAEVHPDKIQGWRKKAQSRALLPTVSVGLDRSATELLHWDTGANPDNLLKGRDFLDWDVSLTWDLGDFIWNPDQTSIDSRSKLMVELREDILDQITRLYFERRRLQFELLAAPLEPQDKIDKEMRLEELTALIDALTGGEFSRRMGLGTEDRRP